MNRLTALLIAAALWAGIFLPGLGSTEMKGEEGRRVMPAVTMLEGGSWIVPEVGGKPFLRKPPLVQWCMAGSMEVLGKNSWAVRLPSALSVLFLAVIIIVGTRGWLISEQSLLAAIIMMVQVATWEKCRLAELEAIYVALSGAAMVLWMSWWAQGRSPWLTWSVVGVLNGLALLAKAPLHLLYFYAIVVAVMGVSGELRRALNWRLIVGWLLVIAGIAGWFLARQVWAPVPFVIGAILLPRESRPHLAGVSIMLAIFAAWQEPYWRSVDHAELAKTVKRQALDRFTGADARLSTWLLNLPNGIANHLPWILFAPLLWRSVATEGWRPRQAALLRGGRWAVAGCFVVLLLIPGVLPRYLQPLTAPFALLLAPVLWECPRRVRHWWRYIAFALTGVVFLGAVASPFLMAQAANEGADVIHPAIAGLALLVVIAAALLLMNLRRRLHETLQLGLWTALVAVLATLLYATTAAPWMQIKEDIRPFAQRIDEKVPKDGHVVAYGMDDYAPLLATLFYMQTPIRYAPEAKSAPAGEQFYLVRGKDRAKFGRAFAIKGEPLVEREEKGGEPSSVLVRAERKQEK